MKSRFRLSDFYIEMPIKPKDDREKERKREQDIEKIQALVLTLIANDTNG